MNFMLSFDPAAEDADTTAPSMWDAMAAFYDDPDFVYGTPLSELRPGPLAQGPAPVPAPAPTPQAMVSSSRPSPRRVLWAPGTVRLLGHWVCDLTGDLAGIVIVRVRAPIVLD